MKIKYNSEIISGTIFAIVGAVLWFLIPLQIKTMEKSAINAQTLPRIAIGGMFIFAIGLLLEGIFAREKRRNWSLRKNPSARLDSKKKCALLCTHCF